MNQKKTSRQKRDQKIASVLVLIVIAFGICNIVRWFEFFMFIMTAMNMSMTKMTTIAMMMMLRSKYSIGFRNYLEFGTLGLVVMMGHVHDVWVDEIRFHKYFSSRFCFRTSIFYFLSANYGFLSDYFLGHVSFLGSFSVSAKLPLWPSTATTIGGLSGIFFFVQSGISFLFIHVFMFSSSNFLTWFDNRQN